MGEMAAAAADLSRFGRAKFSSLTF